MLIPWFWLLHMTKKREETFGAIVLEITKNSKKLPLLSGYNDGLNQTSDEYSIQVQKVQQIKKKEDQKKNMLSFCLCLLNRKSAVLLPQYQIK